MSGPTPTRRRVLSTIAGFGVTLSLAGCTSAQTGSLEPRVSEAKLREDGWSRVDRIDETIAESVSVAGIEQRIRTRVKAVIYENDRPLDAVESAQELDHASVPVPPTAFIASKAQLDPPVLQLALESELARGRILAVTEEMFHSQLENQGLENVRQIEDQSLDIAAAGSASHRIYRADFPYDRREFTSWGQTVTLRPGSFTVEAQLAVWPDEGLLVSAGGLYPGESGTIQLSVNGDAHAVSLDLDPTWYRESVRDLTTTVA